MLMARIIGVEGCGVCPGVIENFKQFGLTYQYIDANSPEYKELMDIHKIDITPVIQIIDSENEEVKHTFFPGAVSPKAVVHKISEILNK